MRLPQQTIHFFVVQDYKENRRKCTVYPLRDLDGLELVRAPARSEMRVAVPGGIWLTLDAPTLETQDRDLLARSGSLVVLDASWARVRGLEQQLDAQCAHVRRSLPGELKTAYPRRSKLFTDPTRGLASVEAMFAATALLGRPRMELLSRYRWTDEFLHTNASLFRRWGLPDSALSRGLVSRAPTG